MKYLTYIVFISSFTNILSSDDNVFDLSVIKTDILRLADEFAKRRANPITSHCFWEQAYTAYVFKRLKDDQLSLPELKEIGNVIQSKDSWHDILTGKEIKSSPLCVKDPLTGNTVDLTMKFLAWNDEMLRPYFKEACINWSKQQESLEKDWREFASRYVSNQN